MSDFLSGKDLRVLMDGCRQEGLHLKVMPALDELLEGNYAFQIRDVDINDLLRREPVELNNDAISTLLDGSHGDGHRRRRQHRLGDLPAGAQVPSQGAGAGRAGREQPVLDRAGASPLRTRRPNCSPCIADITDRARMEQVFAHASAPRSCSTPPRTSTCR